MKSTIVVILVAALLSVSHKPKSQDTIKVKPVQLSSPKPAISAKEKVLNDSIEAVKRQISESIYNVQQSTEVFESISKTAVINAKKIDHLNRLIINKNRVRLHVQPILVPKKEPEKLQLAIPVVADSVIVKKNLFQKIFGKRHEKD